MIKKHNPISFHDLFFVALLAVILGFSAAMASAQTACSPPIFQGSVNATGSCNRLTIRFLNTQSSTLIDRYEVRWTADGVRQTLPGSAIQAVRDDVTCQWSSQLEVTQIMKFGASCSTTSRISPAPHTPACGLCSGGASAGVSIVSAANFRGGVTRGSLVSIFPDPNTTFTDRQEHAASEFLPTSLAGVSIECGNQLIGLLDVAPGQINALLPDNLPDGPTELALIVNSTRGSIGRFTGRVQLNPQAPGIFTASANGNGTAAALWLVVGFANFRYYGMGKLPPLVGNEQVFLILYGTGINASESTLYLSNGRSFVSSYTGRSSGFNGLQQMNYRIPIADVPRGELGAYLIVPAASGGYYTSNGFSVR